MTGQALQGFVCEEKQLMHDQFGIIFIYLERLKAALCLNNWENNNKRSHI